MIILAIIMFAIGYVIAMKTVMLVQLVVVFIAIWNMCSDRVRSMELGAIIPYLGTVALFVGMIAGDIAYYSMTDTTSTINFTHAMKWLVTP